MRSPELITYYLILMSILCVVKALPLLSSPDNMQQIRGDRNMVLGTLVSLLLIYWFGTRQIFSGGYIDTSNYAQEYLILPPEISVLRFEGEWIWTLLMLTCKSLGLDVQVFITIVSAGYILPLIPVAKKIVPSDPYMGLLVIYSSLFFVPFGVNGIRNGLACNLLLLAIAYLLEGRYTICAIITFICFGIHRSTLLPIAAVAFSVFYYRDVKTLIYLWLASIFVSLIAGDWFIEFFAGLGFDDRMSQYAQDLDSDQFSSTSFRWDFLLYSAVPVWFSWYVCVKKRISDNWYNAICCTYLLCNAFWVLVIKAAYSNRFAYLSWFILPLVIVYPLVILPVWHDQDNRTGMVLIAYIAFTFFMNWFWQTF